MMLGPGTNRLAKTASLLQPWTTTTCRRVTTIAYDLGYSSPAAFTVMFKQLVGVAPDAYRRRTSGPARAA